VIRLVKYAIRIENIVASAFLNVEIPLDKVTTKGESVEYEPEQFPGLVYRMSDPNVAFLLFSSGKIVCTGARTKKDVERAIEKLVKKLVKIKALVKE